MMKKRVYRSRDERVIWGVCGGLAKYFDVDPTLIRIIAVLTLFFACTGILIYIILTIIIPPEPRKVAE
jgi:phage shock protein C